MHRCWSSSAHSIQRLHCVHRPESVNNPLYVLCLSADIDECATQMHYCQSNTVCVNLPGSHRCDCLPGFIRVDEYSCTGTLSHTLLTHQKLVFLHLWCKGNNIYIGLVWPLAHISRQWTILTWIDLNGWCFKKCEQNVMFSNGICNSVKSALKLPEEPHGILHLWTVIMVFSPRFGQVLVDSCDWALIASS